MAGVYDAPIPGAAAQGQAELAAKTAYQQALAKLNGNRMNTLRQFGYTANIDPTSGTITGLTVDPHNPYGTYQQTLRSAAQAGDAARDDAISRGISGGLARQAEDQAHYDFGAATGQLATDLQGQLVDFQGQQDDAKSAMDSALYEAQLTGARDAIDQGNFDPADYSQIQDPGFLQEPTVDYGSLFGGPNTAKVGSIEPAPAHSPVAARQKLIQKLLQHHISPSQWARKHPVRANELGIGQKKGSNVQAVKAAVAARKHRKGGR